MILGLCYGHQLLNVAMSGTLYQSIPIEVYKQNYITDIIQAKPDTIHRNYFLASNPPLTRTYNGWFHVLKINKQTPYILKQNDIYILSNHQQAIKKLGKDLDVIATSSDGKIIEIIQHKIYKNVIGIQGHPERQFGLDRLILFPENTKMFHYNFWDKVSSVIIENRNKRVKAGSIK